MKFLATTYTSLKLLSMRGLLLGSAALFFSVMINPAAAAKPDCDIDPQHPSCKPDDGGGGGVDGSTFRVDMDIAGPVPGGSIADWLASFGGKKSIGNNVPGAGLENVGMLDLAFFKLLFLDFPLGTTCFFESGNLNQGIIQRGKHGRAEGLFWFTGQADDAASTPVLYLLKVFGVFDESDDWPPVDMTTLTMNNWQMDVENVGRTIKSNSCIGEGDFGDDSLSIEVTRTN